MIASAASNESSANGSASATPSTAGGRVGWRWAIITGEGSTADDAGSGGSYDPAPAPTLTTVRASPSASRSGRASLGSGWRIVA